MKYKALFLDWDGTLSTGLFWQHWQKEQPELYARLQQCLFVDHESLVIDWMRGQFRAEQIVDILSQSIDLPDNTLSQLEASCRQIRIANPEVTNIIDSLRQNGTKVAIATNNMDTFSRWTSPHLQLPDLVDTILDSWQLGCLKADADQQGNSTFFGSFLEQNGIKPQDCLLIDDTPTNVAVNQFGIDTIIIERGQNIAPILQTFLPEE